MLDPRPMGLYMRMDANAHRSCVIFASNFVPFSQGVLLSLLQQLVCDIGNDTSKKLGWMMDVVLAIKPTDGIISMHI
ncbi:hypothetical protein Hanom_Chr16g01518671 [Helianthus anomalus]